MVRILMLSLVVAGAVGCESTNPQVDENPQPTKNPYEGQLRHVVMFKFKEDTSAAKIREIERAFAALPEKIPTITAYEWGTNNSPEKLDKGFTHCFIVTFEDEKGREVYLPHPAHKEFVALAGPHFADVHVLDFYSKSDAN